MITSLISGTVVGGPHVVNRSEYNDGLQVIWSGGVMLYLKAEHEIEKNTRTLISDSSEINQSSKHARGRGKDSKHATSKNQQVERVGGSIK